MIKLTEDKKIELFTTARVENKKIVAELIEICDYLTEDDVYKFYTNIAGFLFYGQEYLKKADERIKNSIILDFIQERVIELLNASKEDVLMFNKFIHEIHLQFPYCREYAIDELGTLMGYDDEVVLESTNVRQGQVPNDIKKLIDDCLSSISDDLSYVVTTTWRYCHLDCGIDYQYQANEKIQVDLTSLSQQALDLAVDRLSKLNATLAK